MNSINKIFVGGSVVSGKNILWRLLDGHSSMVSNCMHSNLGYFVLNDNCKNFFLRERPTFAKEWNTSIPTCKISYSTGEVASVDIGSFLYGLYSYFFINCIIKGRTFTIIFKIQVGLRFDQDLNNRGVTIFCSIVERR